MKLVDLPGVGSRIRERLREHYGNEDVALEALSRGDVVGLKNVLSERQAITIIQRVRGMNYGVKPDEFLATAEVVKVYQMLISRIAGYAHTEYARSKIYTLFPSSSPELLAENRRIAQIAMENANLVERCKIDEYLSKIKPLREKAPSRVRERVVATTSVEVLKQLKDRGLDKLIDLQLAENSKELMDLAASYSYVSLVGDDAEELHNLERVQSLEEWYLVPEGVLGFYKDNLDLLCAAVEVARRLQDTGIRSFSGLDDLQKLISQLAENADDEAMRIFRLLSRLNEIVSEAASWANEELKKKIECSSITFAGMDILQVMSRGEGIRELFEIQMSGLFREVVKEARARAACKLELQGREEIWMDEIFSSEVCYPLELNKQALRAFEQGLRNRMEARSLKTKRELARELAGKKETANEIIYALMEFDFSYALGCFALAEGLSIPEIMEEPCLSFEDGRNLFLDNPDPVRYSLGTPDHPEKVALLSGVNSGGKTSLLDLMAQIVILAHMGLPVPARHCLIGLFQEIYYFNKSQGTLSAGAFETAIRKFSVVGNRKRKLILADELESITEPGASARIIAFMLDELNLLGSVAIFVSHLAEDVKRLAGTPVRIDGIEASGLDDNNNLIVDRSPRYNYLARSTPELILDRLVRSTHGQESEFYSRLLAMFR